MKGKLSVPILAGILVFGTIAAGFSFSDAHATHYRGGQMVIGDKLILKTKGVSQCEDEKGNFCGAAKTKMRLKLTVDEISKDIVSGTAKGVIYIHGTADDFKDYSWTLDTTTESISVASGKEGPIELFKVEINGWFLPEVDDQVFLKSTLFKEGKTLTGFNLGVVLEKLVDKSAEK